jgi:site-specific DNA-cytosine methylase
VGKRKITCNNSSCKHHTNGGCDTCITLDGSGKCKSFEKGFAYYFHIVWDALDNKNFIDMVEIRMNPDLKTGLFYVMECYDLGFSEMEWGTCRMVMLKDGKEGKPLKYEEIIEREMNMEKFSKHLENFNNGIMPQMQQEQDAAGQQDKEEKEFGWLSPTGVFTESPFGTHEESAEQICEEKGFTISVLNGEKFEFDDLIRTPMRNLQEFLEDDVPDIYDVTQPSVLACIGEKGIRRATVIKDCAYTITTRQDRTPAQVIDRGDGRYRYLTERECWRLMGYTDEDFDRAKAVQERNGKYYKALYDQAGNSIAVPIFESIFRKIILQEVA